MRTGNARCERANHHADLSRELSTGDTVLAACKTSALRSASWRPPNYLLQGTENLRMR